MEPELCRDIVTTPLRAEEESHAPERIPKWKSAPLKAVSHWAAEPISGVVINRIDFQSMEAGLSGQRQGHVRADVAGATKPWGAPVLTLAPVLEGTLAPDPKLEWTLASPKSHAVLSLKTTDRVL